MDPLNLTPAMRKAYDFIVKNGHATAAHPQVSEPSAQALRNRGLVEMYSIPTGYKNTQAWVVVPLGKPMPKKVKLPHIRKAHSATISRLLGNSLDEDGNPLVRARYTKTDGDGPQHGGYSTMQSGNEGVVIVSYVTPDDMDLVAALEVRPKMLKRYAEIIRAAQYEVREDIEYGVLFVSR